MKRLVCVLCGKPAYTTAAHIPVCEDHHKEYQEEGRKYLADRPFYRSLLSAYEQGTHETDHVTNL